MKKFLKAMRNESGNFSERSLVIAGVAMTFIALVMTVINYVTDAGTVMYVTLGVFSWFVFSIIIYMASKNRYLLLGTFLMATYFMMMYFVVSGGVEGFSIVWLLIVPPAGMYCFGLYYGTIFSGLINISLVVYMWTPLFDLGYAYTDTYRLRFPLVYFVVVVLCSVIQYRVYASNEQKAALIEKLENANRTKGDFLANMSHEIRTPMNSIIGMCELIMRDDINDSVRENCYNIQNSGRNLLAIINDILDFSKIESGKTEIIEENFNIGSTINDVINMAVTRVGDKDIELIVRVDAKIPAVLVGDEIRIRQVIINLMSNAVKFTNQGCVILEMTHTKTTEGIVLEVSIEDTGIGITKDNIKKLFTSFQQVDTKKNRAVEGTGLGLAISKGLVLRMGGTINVESEYGKGSRFSVTIPLRTADDRPFAHINNSENINVAVCLEGRKYIHPKIGEQYYKLLEELSVGLDTRIKRFETLEQLEEAIETGEYTHCFVPQSVYLENADLFVELEKKIKLAVMQDRFCKIALPETVKTVYKPFYSLTFANLINNEKLIDESRDKKKNMPTFTAPTAKVLVVDDNIINRKVAEGLMKPFGMQIVSAESGMAALEAVKSQDFDIIFMDHMMPEMDGVEAFTLIRNMEGDYYKNIPVIMLTANAIDGVRESFMEAGFNDYMSKPIETPVLYRILKTWLPKEKIVEKGM